jgi:hypothetical protein
VALNEDHAHEDEQDLHQQFRLGLSPLHDEGGHEGAYQGRLGQVIQWLTGIDEPALSGHLAAGTTFEDFFADARLNPHATLTGVVCGVRRKCRRPVDAEDSLPGLVDELAKGKSLDRILRA